MPENKKVTRKLSAILSADVKGYSVLLADDEVHTIETLKAYRHIISDLVSKHSGRVVDSPGDNILAEFRSSVDAVECAVKIQKTLDKENSKYVDDKKVQFRIGVNVGDVIQDGDRIYGNGVNVAARIEGLADPGGVCISRNVYDHVSNKLSLGYGYLGEHTVKNIKKPVRVYKLLMADKDAGKLIGVKKKTSMLKWVLAAILSFLLVATVVLGGFYWKFIYLPAPKDFDPENKLSFDLPKGPSLAVLPFDNMTGDPEQDYFCDGITENIIAVLSHIPQLIVIARNSTFAYKSKSINVQQIGHELGAQYVIEGSIQKSFERVRITVQLIDTKSGHHLWSERYDRELKNIFRLQDEIAIEITKAMQIHITEGEIVKTRYADIPDLQTYLKVLKAVGYFNHSTKESNILARKETEELLSMNIGAANPYSLLGFIYLQGIQVEACESDLICLGKATEAARKALSLSPGDSDAHSLASYLFLYRKEHEKAILEARNAIVLNPNNADAYIMLGTVLRCSERPEEAIGVIKKGIRLNPIPPVYYLFQLAWAYRVSKQFENAIDMYNQCLKRNSDLWYVYSGLAVTYYFIGREIEARTAIKEALNLYPDLSIKIFRKNSRYKNQTEIEHVVEAARKLGVPE